MALIALVLLSFLCGSLPFSYWLGKLFLGRDVRRYGDGNPGAANVFRSGGRAVGVLALLLDISKAAAPVGWAYFDLGYRGWPMLLIAVAPMLGHAFSPFLSFRGGKAIATALGVWIGLSLWRVSVPAVLLVLFWTALIDASGWAVMLTLVGLAVGLALWMPNPLLLAVLAAQALLLGWKHRAELGRRPRMRAWVSQFIEQANN